MPRHTKHNATGSFFNAFERALTGAGTNSVRVGGDGTKGYDVCTLCLKPAVQPQCCRKGHLFCKECIFENLLTQKSEIRRKTALWEAQQKVLADKELQKQDATNAQKLQRFDEQESSILPSASRGKEEAPVRDPNKTLVCYWLPSLGPDQQPVYLEKPSQKTTCYDGTHSLGVNSLIPVNFTSVRQIQATDPNFVKSGRYECPSCIKTITNGMVTCLIRRCGHVTCKGCNDRFVVPNCKCFVCNEPVRPNKDIVTLQAGGTSFAASQSVSGENLQPKRYSTQGMWG